MTKINFPDKKYKVIVVDPPWKLKKANRKVRPNQKYMDYKMMSLKEIKDLPIEILADENSVLFLWVINKYIFEAKDILEGWGFNYHLVMAWDKGNGMPMFRFRRQTEFVVVGFKGKHPIFPNGKLIPTSFSFKSKKHSAKPDEFYKMIEVFNGPRIDIFARQRHEGFDAWGDEVKNDLQKVLSNSIVPPSNSASQVSKADEHNISLKDNSNELSQISSKDETSLNNNIKRNFGFCSKGLQ